MEDVPDGGTRDWLRGEEETESNRTDGSTSMLTTEPEPKKMRQLEIEFVKRIADTWPSLNPEIRPEGGKIVKKRKKTLKKLAKENSKMSSWLVSKNVADQDETLAVE